ncbi:MAG: hypothetical protein GX230_09400 [Lentisphaerae bacterium]|jgi:transcription elongation factor Elf1|nr:hypothetical protein [Lentisphaerota bacterium]
MSQLDYSDDRIEAAADVEEAADFNAVDVLDEHGDDFDSETDIIFDCPHCEHQLIIHVRGAGLTVNCTECGKPVAVPIPEGIEMSDFDESAEELFVQVLQLRRALASAEERNAELVATVAELREYRSALESARVRMGDRCADIREQMILIHQAQSEIAEATEQIEALLAEEE